MKILTDMELKQPDKFLILNPAQTKLVEGIRDFIKQRLSVLSDEIDIESKIYGGKIILCIMEKPWGLAYDKFSEKLKTKITDCLTPEDLEYIQIKIAKELGLI